jgi:NTP pyrophosphatase (non-canonical NTP hydrolase)
MNQKQREILVITQEEAAEVIQEISKVFRFGIDVQHRDGMTHRTKLETEIGDLLCMIDMMIDNRLIDPTKLELARQAKIQKLKRFSGIFES